MSAMRSLVCLIEAGADSEEPLRFAQAFGKNRMIEILTKPVTKPVLVEVPEARKNTEEGRENSVEQ